MQSLLDSGNEKELSHRLNSRLSFGTAGLRAAMGAGWNRMNDLTVAQASQVIRSTFDKKGLCLSLIQLEPDIQSKGVVIGHDHRHFSAQFARFHLKRLFDRIAASVFLFKNIPVYLYGKLVHTPLVVFLF
jgi:phosphoglucomutase/phosphopentomutase